METNSSGSHALFCAISYNETRACLETKPAAVCFIAYTITNIAIQLPLCIYIIYLGFQRQQSGTPMTHSDFFTYHIVAVELIGILGTLAIVCAIYTELCFMNLLGTVTILCYSFGQMSINILSCGERYLAAVYPITYLGLRKAKGIRIRNIAMTCAWLNAFGWTFFTVVQPKLATLLSCCLTVCAIIIVSFFCVSVLRVLTVPGPGEKGGASVQVDRIKLKAFYVKTVITVGLLLRFGGNILTIALFFMPEPGSIERCIVSICIQWTLVPSSVLLPLLFLHRAEKLACIKKTP